MKWLQAMPTQCPQVTISGMEIDKKIVMFTLNGTTRWPPDESLNTYFPIIC